MTLFIERLILAAGGSLAASIVVKATLALILALGGAWLLRGQRAALRHAALAAAFGVLLVLPAAALFAPAIRITMPAAAPERILNTPSTPPYAALNQSRSKPAIPQPAAIPFGELLIALWLSGATLFLAPIAIGLWQIGRVRRAASSCSRTQSAVDALVRESGVRRRVQALVNGSISGPMTCGIVRPAIVLSQDAPTWNDDELGRALVHELEHVRRFDWATHCLARVACAVYWFHPLVWIAWRRLALEAERACDDAVVSRSEATDYADQLIELAQRMQAAGRPPLLAMASRSDLYTRVGAVLDKRQRRGRAGIGAIALACSAALALALTISPLRLVAAPQALPPVDTAVNLRASTALVVETVVVRDQSLRPIEGLTANDFAIAEDGAPQVISIFEAQNVDPSFIVNGIPVSSYYLIGYYSRNTARDGTYRRIKVTCSHPDAILTSRQGYYAGPTPKPVTSDNPTNGTSVSSTMQQQHRPPGVAYPELMHKVEAGYSEEARRAKFQGLCFIQAAVDANGNVVDTRLLRSLGLGLNEKALEAIKQWKFKPGTLNGNPVTMWVTVTFDFRLV
jgi:TonB family protein